MSAFRRTLRLLDEDGRSRWKWTVASLFIVLMAWTAWFAFARVPLYEVSEAARIELDEGAFAIDAPLSGQVVTSTLSLGKRVRAGDILLELDTEQFAIQKQELTAKRAGLAIEATALQSEMEAHRSAIAHAASVSGLAQRESQARAEEAEAAAKFAAEEASRATRLHAAGLLGELDLLRARSEAEKRRAAADALRASGSRQTADEEVKQRDRAARLHVLEREIAALDGQRRTLSVAIEGATHEIERRRIRATASGVVAEASDLRPGAFIEEGDRIATLATNGRLRVIASFSPAAAGRLKSGQSGRLRLDGYPWQQYGTLPVVVQHVASELRDAKIRVELVLLRRPTGIPVQHALPGTVEVEVEGISPATLVMRSAGRRAKNARSS